MFFNIKQRESLMKLNKGIIYLPKNRKNQPVKWLCICAHQDDCEIMAS